MLFADLASAFDTVRHDDIRRALFGAGIVGQMWLLLDDLLASDLASVNINGVSSGFFKLYAGTAQGRKLSAHLFNCVMRYLHDCIAQRSQGIEVSSGASPVLVNELATQIVDIQYSDDLAAPAAGAHQLKQIAHGCEDFSRLHGPKFNLGRCKAAILGPCLDHEVTYLG